MEHLRKKQARKIYELKSEVDSSQHSSQENRVVADNAVQALSSELRTTKAALMAVQNREKAVSIAVLLTLLHSERPKLYTILAFLSAIGLSAQIPSSEVPLEGFVCLT